MRNFIIILRSEAKHFLRSPFKVISVLLFMGAAVYGLQNGYRLFQVQNAEIAEIKKKNDESVKKVVAWYDAGKKGPDDRTWIDITHPFWANWFAPATATKAPSTLMPFNIGQAEQFGYYKRVTNRSTTFDSDLAEEIANPERLTIGTLDFGFVILFFSPILAIILLFNIGGLEKDLAFNQLIEVNISARNKWILARFSFYFLLLLTALLALMLPYAALSGALQNHVSGFLALIFYLILYTLLWFFAFYVINLSGKGSANQAVRMLTVWLVVCIILPGGIHQISSIKYPASYMTEYIDATRDKSDKYWELPIDEQRKKLIKIKPELLNTLHAKDSTANQGIIGYSRSAIANNLMLATTTKIETSQEEKNKFIQATYWFNPIGFFQNKMNSLADNDYYAYKKLRKNIQSIIDKKTNAILFDCWNKEIIDKEKYLKYVDHFNQ